MRARSSEANGAGIDAVLDWIGVPAASVTVSTVNTVIASADPSLVTGLADKCLCEGNIQLSPGDDVLLLRKGPKFMRLHSRRSRIRVARGVRPRASSGINLGFADLVFEGARLRPSPSWETYHEDAHCCSRTGHFGSRPDPRSARERGADVSGELLIRV